MLGRSPSTKTAHSEDGQRSFSRQSLRNSHQEPSTDSETKEGSQDSGAEDFKRQTSEESRRISFDNRQISTESRQGSFETRQSSHESRQSSFDGRQASHDGNQTGGPRLGTDGRTASRESGLSRESSADSAAADLEGGGSNLSPSANQTKVGTKRGRLLMRQQRVKKESDVRASPDSDPGSPGFPPSVNLLNVPPVKIERQRSEPASTVHTRSPPPQAGSNLLAVPRPSFPARQHSFPSQSPPTFPSGTLLVQRQLSQPLTSAKSVQMAEEPSRAASPSVASESLPVVRIISDADQSKTNSSYRQRSEETKRQPTPEIPETCRSVHCPVLRTGPALGCNYCWNTIDAHGRILRRKTKYHCPECQTNLCIVPCFQEYHHRQVEISGKTEAQGQPSAS